MEQAKQGGNETAPEMAGYYRGAGCFSLKAAELNELLGVGRCFDMTGRDLSIGGRQARLWVVNGYAQEDLLERVIAGWQALPGLDDVTDAADFCRRYVSACDAAAWCWTPSSSPPGRWRSRIPAGYCGAATTAS